MRSERQNGFYLQWSSYHPSVHSRAGMSVKDLGKRPHRRWCQNFFLGGNSGGRQPGLAAFTVRTSAPPLLIGLRNPETLVTLAFLLVFIEFSSYIQLHPMCSVSKRFINMAQINDEQLFRYDPLVRRDSIRLFILQPGIPGTTIRGTLLHTTVTECDENIYEHYTTLSYVWGDSTNRVTIYISDKPLNITKNLAEALDGMRHESKLLRVWADAICIDQWNLLERNHQVGLMRDIYSRAADTIVYLGTPDVGSMSSSCTLIKAMRRRDRNANLDHDFLKTAAVEILSWPWFTRVWTYQELVLSKKVWVQLGRDRTKWSQLCTAFKSITFNAMSYAKSEIDILRHMDEVRRLYNASLFVPTQTPASLLDILFSRRGMGVSDMRDIIYGHLAVADLHHSNEDPIISVDYRKSVSQVFIDAGLQIFLKGTSTDIRRMLLAAETRDFGYRRKGLPSWVPDWSLGSAHSLPKIILNDYKELYRETAIASVFAIDDLPIVGFLERGTVLEFDTIRATSNSFDEEVAKHFKKLAYVEKVKDISDDNTGSRQGKKLERDVIILNRAAAFHRAYDFWKEWLGNEFYTFPPLPIEPDTLYKTREYSNVWYLSEWLRRHKMDPTISRYVNEGNENRSHEMCFSSLGVLLIAHTLSGNILDLLDGRKIARFVTGSTGIVPSNSQAKDFLLVKKPIVGGFPIVLRPLTGDIDSKLNEKIYKKLELADPSDNPILHCTVIGEGWSEASSMSIESWTKTYREWKELRQPYIFAFH
jgi:hypothetical protein